MVKSIKKKPVIKRAKIKKVDSKNIPKQELKDYYNICATIDKEEKFSNISSVSVGSTVDPAMCISTGVLSLDLMLGGGLAPGHWYELVGRERGGKTTLADEICHNILISIPRYTVGAFIDVEGTLDYTWFSNIVKVKNLEEIFGKKNKKTTKILKQ